MALAAVLLFTPVRAQTPAPTPNADETLSEVVVTGTNIRGVAAVGSDVVSLDRTAIEQTDAQTVQQMLRDIPSISSSGATPQGLNPGNTYFSPTIHGLGGSSSNSTLVLIDGHRVAPRQSGRLDRSEHHPAHRP